MYSIIGWALTGLLLLGVITLQRIVKRNTVTDGYKKDMDQIRERFRDYFDDDGVLDDYKPFGPTPILRTGTKTENSRHRNVGNNIALASISKSMRRPGGLAYLVLVMNTILLFAIIKVFITDIEIFAWILITIGFILLQVLWMVIMENK